MQAAQRNVPAMQAAQRNGKKEPVLGMEQQCQLIDAIDVLIQRHRSDLLSFLHEVDVLDLFEEKRTSAAQFASTGQGPNIESDRGAARVKFQQYMQQDVQQYTEEEDHQEVDVDELKPFHAVTSASIVKVESMPSIADNTAPRIELQDIQEDTELPETSSLSLDPPGCVSDDAPTTFSVVPMTCPASKGLQQVMAVSKATPYRNGANRWEEDDIIRPSAAVRLLSMRHSNFREALIRNRPRTSSGAQPVVDAVGERVQRHKAKTMKEVRRQGKDFILARNIQQAKEDRNTLQKVTQSQCYETASALAVIMNASFIGLQTQTIADKARRGDTGEEPPIDLVLAVLFAIAFSVDLGLRLAADGFVLFFSHDRTWNVMDVIVVIFTNVDLLLELCFSTQNNISKRVSMLRVLRVVRIVRVVKVVRVLRYFRELRVMILSISHSLKSLVWVLMIIGLMFYMFAVGFTAAAASHLLETNSQNDSSTEALQLAFGSLDVALLSMFMAMSGGDDWGFFYRALEPVGPLYRMVFLFYMAFALFAVVNIVTGVYVHSAMENTNKDMDSIVKEQMQKKEDYLNRLSKIFEEADTNSSGNLTWEEFERCMDDERFVFFLEAMQIDSHDARRLFMLLDTDHSHCVSVTEFLTGCYRLQGHAKAMDTIMMYFQVEYLSEMVTDLAEGLEEAGFLSGVRSPSARKRSSALAFMAAE